MSGESKKIPIPPEEEYKVGVRVRTSLILALGITAVFTNYTDGCSSNSNKASLDSVENQSSNVTTIVEP